MQGGVFAGSGGASGAARIAKAVGLAVIVGILAADGLASLAERGALPRLSIEWPNVDAGAKAAQRVEVVTTYRSIGVDGVTTSSIRALRPAAPVKASALSPCGETE